ncbi:MAG: hypothetical protein AAB523_01860 [Patescibacteria group bacterium]
MSYQWFYVFTVALASGIFFWTGNAERAAYLGWMSLAAAVLFMGYVVSTGIRARRLREGKPEEPDAVDVHRIHVAILTTFILVGVVGMEIAVRKSGGLWGDPALVAFHFVLVGLSTTTYLLARFRLTGLSAPRRHRYVTYPFIVFFIATFTTGTILLWRQFLFA